MEALEYQDAESRDHRQANGSIDVVEPGGRDKDGAKPFGLEAGHGVDQGFGSGVPSCNERIVPHARESLKICLDGIE